MLEQDELFDCDMFVFCASKGVPPVGAAGDVRIAQLEANSQLVGIYADMAVKAGFGGIFAVVSDAAKDQRFSQYLRDGRAFGPHGADLVIADSISAYDDELSAELTELTVRANMKVREDGFKPYIAPAMSSGAISLAATLRGEWNYSSVYLGKGHSGAFLGCRNRRSSEGIIVEDLPLDERLFSRIRHAYDELRALR